MKKLYYESPTVDIVDVRVEKGFGVSDVEVHNIFDYSTIDEGNMGEVDSY